MNKSAFSFYELPGCTPKPRKVGLCIGTDFGLPLGFVENFLESHHEIIDYAKLTDHAGLASRYSADFWHKKLAIYHKYNVRTFIGGVDFELAFIQNKVSNYFETAKDLGFDAIEVSDDIIPKLDRKTRSAIIKQATSVGLEVFTEVGEKFPDPAKPLDMKETLETLQADLQAGASKITVENSDTAILREKNPQALIDLANKVGLEKLVFEVMGSGTNLRDIGIWLLNTISRDINLQNLKLGEDCILLYSFRRGFGRQIGYDFFRGEKGNAK